MVYMNKGILILMYFIIAVLCFYMMKKLNDMVNR